MRPSAKSGKRGNAAIDRTSKIKGDAATRPTFIQEKARAFFCAVLSDNARALLSHCTSRLLSVACTRWHALGVF